MLPTLPGVHDLWSDACRGEAPLQSRPSRLAVIAPAPLRYFVPKDAPAAELWLPGGSWCRSTRGPWWWQARVCSLAPCHVRRFCRSSWNSSLRANPVHNDLTGGCVPTVSSHLLCVFFSRSFLLLYICFAGDRWQMPNAQIAPFRALRCRHAPPATWWLLLVCVALFWKADLVPWRCSTSFRAAHGGLSAEWRRLWWNLLISWQSAVCRCAAHLVRFCWYVGRSGVLS